ncbi:Late embryogenesis abundant protein LEA_3 subgroup [Arabidopsis suecica]|nr:senescence-associated gene 21 [Arabidopsis thaliana]ANM66423.1 senescence-associated gene 21 [Arabidopsis thaliana]KAG7619368.1 Late embryogenesis abundant protein LEA_3 subgroup [Arabidopsis suecica]|eukprot:NP_001328319.1 senescence-associated gene 21 [Arabidopsis thaliana]
MRSEKTISESLPLFPLFLHSLLYKPSSPLPLFSSLQTIFESLERENTDDTNFLQSRCRSIIISFLGYISPSAAATRSYKNKKSVFSLFKKPLTSKMARSISNVKIVSAFVSRELSNAIFRRGYAATAAQGSVSSGGRSGAVASAVMKKKGVEESTQKISWVPDPKTGYYRPETGSNEIDAAELRAALLNNKQ